MKTKVNKQKKADLTTNISVITLNRNQLTTPVKTQRLAEWIKKNNPIIGQQETHFK